MKLATLPCGAVKWDFPGLKVSWQVTGNRQNARANGHRFPVEVEKPERERGYYIHPELYGASVEKGIAWARNSGMMKQIKKHQAKAEQLKATAAKKR